MLKANNELIPKTSTKNNFFIYHSFYAITYTMILLYILTLKEIRCKNFKLYKQNEGTLFTEMQI